MKKYETHGMVFILESGWWLTYPSEKYERQWKDDPIYEMENKQCSKPPTRN